MNQTYERILLAVDFTGHGELAVERATVLAKLHGAELMLLHVVEALPMTESAYGPFIALDIDLTEPMIEAARSRLDVLGAKLGVADERRFLEVGSPKLEIVRVAKAENADLIVVGSHGRHGVALLLGSTASGVIHHAHCDVLAVRLKED